MAKRGSKKKEDKPTAARKRKPKTLKKFNLKKWSESNKNIINLFLVIFTALMFIAIAWQAILIREDINLTKKEVLKEPDFSIDFTYNYGLETNKKICADVGLDSGELVLTNIGYRDIYFNIPGKIIQKCENNDARVGGMEVLNKFLPVTGPPLIVKYHIPPPLTVGRCDFIFELKSSSGMTKIKTLSDVNVAICKPQS